MNINYKIICEEWDAPRASQDLDAMFRKGAGALAGTAIGSVVGAGVGGGLGGYAGHKIAHAVSGNTQRKRIKEIILQSNTPQEAINALKQMSTDKAFDYAEIVEKYSSLPNWKEKVLNGMMWRKAGITALGAVPGAYVGANAGLALGALGGAATGLALG